MDVLLLVDLRQIAELTQHFIQVCHIRGVTLNHDPVPAYMLALVD